MWKTWGVTMGLAASLAAQAVREVALDPRQVVEVPVSREVTTILFPGPITAVAGADLLIESGREPVELEEGTVLRFHVSHAAGSNFLLVRSLQPEAAARLTTIYDGSAYVLQLRTVASESTASVIFQPLPPATAKPVEAPPEPVKFSPRIGLSLLDRARAYPVLARALPKAVEGVTLSAQHRKITLPDVEIDVQEVYRFAKEDAVVFLVRLTNTTDREIELAPSTFAARVADEKFEQSIANGPRTLAPGASADAEFAVVGMPDGTRNDLSADNAFTVLITTSRREPAAAAGSDTPVIAEASPP
jgi:hypothetical protein